MAKYQPELTYKGLKNVSCQTHGSNVGNIPSGWCVVIQAEHADRMFEGASPTFEYMDQAEVDLMVANKNPDPYSPFDPVLFYGVPEEPVITPSEDGEGATPTGEPTDPPAPASSEESGAQSEGGDTGVTEEAAQTAESSEVPPETKSEETTSDTAAPQTSEEPVSPSENTEGQTTEPSTSSDSTESTATTEEAPVVPAADAIPAAPAAETTPTEEQKPARRFGNKDK